MNTINRYIFVAAVSVYGGHAADIELEMENFTEKREKAAATKIQSVLRMHAVKIRVFRVTDANFVHPLQFQSDAKKKSTSPIAITHTNIVKPKDNENHDPYRVYTVQHAPGKRVYKRYSEFHDLYRQLTGPLGALSLTSGLPSPPEFPQDARELNEPMVSRRQKLNAYLEYVLTNLRDHPAVQAFISSAPAETLDYQMTLTLPAVALPKGCELDERFTVKTAPDEASNYIGLTVAEYSHAGKTYTVNPGDGQISELNDMLEKKECSVRLRKNR